MKKLWLLVPLFALSGCSMFSGDTNFPLQELAPDPEIVKDCRLIGTFPGPGGYRFAGPPPVLSDFKLRTAEKAKRMGATHIYWWEGGGKVQGEMTGFAFDCTGVDMSTGDGYEEGY